MYSSDAFVDAIGVNTHFGFSGGSNEVWAKEFEALAASTHELGIRSVRDSVRMGDKLERLNRLYKQYGIRTDLQVFQRGLEPEEVIRRSEAWIQALRRQVAPQAVLAFEGPNEYNDTRATRPNWAQENCQMQEALFKTIRACPEYAHCQIVAPSVWFRIHDDFVALAKTGIDSWCTRGCVHYYTGGNIPTLFRRHVKFDTGKWTPMAEVLAEAQLVVPGKPIWVTETGYGYLTDAHDSSSSISENSVAKYLPRLLVEWFRTGKIERIFIYDLVDDKKVYGLLRHDLTRRPAFFAVKHLLQLLADPGPRSQAPTSFACELQGASGDVHSLVLQKRDGQVLLLLWQEVCSWDLQAKKELQPKAQPVVISFPRAVSGEVVVPGCEPKCGEPGARFVEQKNISVPVTDEIVLVRINSEKPARP